MLWKKSVRWRKTLIPHYLIFRGTLMGAQAFLHAALQALALKLQQILPDSLNWAIAPVRRTLEYAVGPLFDDTGRFPWWGLTFALLITTGVYLLRRDQARGGFLRFCFPREVFLNSSTWVDLKVGFLNHVLFGGGIINVTWRLSTAFFASWITSRLVAEFGPVEHPATW